MPAGFRATCKQYLNHLLARNYSHETILSQSKQLRYFAAFCSRHAVKRPTSVTRDTIAAYQLELHTKPNHQGHPLSVGCQRQRLAVVSSFFKHLTRYQIVPTNPAGELEMPRSEHRLPKMILTVPEIEKIISLPDISDPPGLRDRAILEVFYSTGIRRKELCNLNLMDVDYSRRIVRVEQGKGNKDRYVPIGRRALAWIEEYLKESRPLLGRTQDTHALFLSTNGVRMIPDCLSFRIRFWIRVARLGKTGSCHALRHAFATALLDNGCDVRHIQAMMGHAKLETTAIYLHLGMHDIKAAHDKFHPASRIDPRKMPPSSSPNGHKQLLLNLEFKPCPPRRRT